jgi:hypothetical protein
LGEFLAFVFVLPCGAEMFEVARGRGERGDFPDIVRGLPWKDLGAAVDAGMAEPAFGGRDESRGNFRAVSAGEFAGDSAVLRFPGEVEAAVGEFVLVWEVEERGKEEAFLDRAWFNDLRNGEHLLLTTAAALAGEVKGGDGGVRRAEINSYGVTSHGVRVRLRLERRRDNRWHR